MICKNCGTKLPDDSVFCENCGVRLTIDENSAADKNTFKQQPKTEASAKISSAKAASPVPDEKDLLEAKYNEGVKILNEAQTPNDYAAAVKIFISLKGYKDSKQKEALCKEKFSEIIYSQAVDILKSADNEEALSRAKSYFQQLGDYMDSKELLSSCQKKLKDIDNEKRYEEAVKLLNIYTDEVNITRAVNLLKGLDPYKESTRLLEEAEGDLKELKYKALVKSKTYRSPETNLSKLAEEFKKLGDYKAAKKFAEECEEIIREEKRQAENKIKNRKKLLIFSVIACAVIIAAVIIYIPLKKSLDRNHSYKTAVSLYEIGDYAQAAYMFEELGDYKDSMQKLSEANQKLDQLNLETGIEYYNSGDYLMALPFFQSSTLMDDTSEKTEWREKCEESIYQYGLEQYDAGNYDEARKYFNNIPNYKDASDISENCEKGNTYNSAVESYNAGNYDEALEQFKTITGFKDADSYIDSINTMGMLEDCKQAYINYLSESRTYGGYTAYDLSYLLYDVDGNGIPELFTEEFAGSGDGVPTRITVILTYDGSLKTLYKDTWGFYYYMSNSGKLYYRSITFDAGDYDIYEWSIVNGELISSIAYSNIYTSDMPGQYEENGSRTNLYDIGLSYFESYDGNDFSAIYNY